jgi:2'-5' RNA ligase
MKRHLFTSTLPLAAIIAALIAIPAQARTDSTATRTPPTTGAPEEKVVKRGFLFSSISLGKSALGVEWSRLRPEAEAMFPGLKLTRPEDLHITVIYIGGDWKDQDLGRIRAHARVVPASPGRMTPEIVRMGRNNQVVAIEELGAPQAWTDSVIAAKSKLNRLGLKQPDNYDTSFRTHVTLAEARHNPPSASDSTELATFTAWITPRVAADPAKFSVEVGPKTRVELLLAGTTRPAGSPEYITVEAFLEAQETPAIAR